MFIADALGERFQGDEYKRAIGSAAAEAESGDGEHAGHFFHGLNGDFGLLADVGRVFERGAFRRLHGDDEVTGVFGGDEAARDPLVDPVGETQAGDEQRHGGELVPQEKAQQGLVAVSKSRQSRD